MTWHIGDSVRIERIDFAGHIERIVWTSDPVVVLQSEGGAELTMRGSVLEREAKPCSIDPGEDT